MGRHAKGQGHDEPEEICLFASPTGQGQHTASSAAASSVSLSGIFRRLFVPSGEIAPDYLEFQILDSIQATSSYLRGVLTTFQTLQGAGFATTNDQAAALSSVITFILKDGASMLGSLLFSYFFAGALDTELRFWRLFADLVNDLGLTLELLAPLAGPRYFLWVSALGNVCKALCGVTAGATRVALSHHFASSVGKSNVAEVQAKEQAQETAITLLGLTLGLLFAEKLNSSLVMQLGAFSVLTLVHVIANYRAVKCLRLTTLTRTRLVTMATRLQKAQEQGQGLEMVDLSPASIAKEEPLVPVQYPQRLLSSFFLPGFLRSLALRLWGRFISPVEAREIRLGVSKATLIRSCRAGGAGDAVAVERGEDDGDSAVVASSPCSIVVAFRHPTGNAEVLSRYARAMELACAGTGGNAAAAACSWQLVQEQSFVQRLQAQGWAVDSFLSSDVARRTSSAAPCTALGDEGFRLSRQALEDKVSVSMPGTAGSEAVAAASLPKPRPRPRAASSSSSSSKRKLP